MLEAQCPNGLVGRPNAPVCTTKVLEGLVSGTASPLTCGLELTRPSYEPKETWQGSKSNGYATARPMPSHLRSPIVLCGLRQRRDAHPPAWRPRRDSGRLA